jgi:hypothetical protein
VGARRVCEGQGPGGAHPIHIGCRSRPLGRKPQHCTVPVAPTCCVKASGWGMRTISSIHTVSTVARAPAWYCVLPMLRCAMPSGFGYWAPGLAPRPNVKD